MTQRYAEVALCYHLPAGAVYHYGLEQRTKVSIQSGPLAAMGNQQPMDMLTDTESSIFLLPDK